MKKAYKMQYYTHIRKSKLKYFGFLIMIFFFLYNETINPRLVLEETLCKENFPFSFCPLWNEDIWNHNTHWNKQKNMSSVQVYFFQAEVNMK